MNATIRPSAAAAAVAGQVPVRKIKRPRISQAAGLALASAAHRPKRPKRIDDAQKKLLAVIATLLAQIDPDETTKSVDRIRRQVRRYLQGWHYWERDNYDKVVAQANDEWKRVAAIVEKERPAVSMSESFYALSEFIDFSQMPFSESGLHKAARSIETMASKSDIPADEASRNAFRLMDLIAEGFGFAYTPKLTGVIGKVKAQKALKEKEKEAGL